jgi:hypothetical protein
MLHETFLGVMLDFVSDLIFSMVDESLDRLFGFRYRDRVEALNVFNTRFRGSSRQSSE